MNDMSQVIIPKSDQLNAEDFLAGPRTYTIESVEIRAGTEQPVTIHLKGESRAWKPCKSMSRVLVAAWGPDANAYIGRSVTLYNDPKVKWGGMEVGGIRVSHLSHIERDMLLQLTATKGKRAPHMVRPLQVQQQQRPQADDPAVGWAERYIAAVQNALDMQELNELRRKQAPKLTEMKAKRPDLYARVIEADPHSAIPDRPANGEEAPADDAPNHSGEQAAPEQPAMELE